MSSDELGMERAFEQAAATALQNQQGYYPISVALPGAEGFLAEFDYRLVQLDSYGTPNVVLMRVLDGEDRRAFLSGGLRKRMLESAKQAAASVEGNKSVHVSIALISAEPLSRREARMNLGSVKLSRKPTLEVGVYWVTPTRRRFQSGHHFLSPAPNRSLNPCYPEPNIFSQLLRKGWKDVGEPPAADRQVKAFEAERS